MLKHIFSQSKGFIIGSIVTGIITTSLFSFGSGIIKTIQVGENSVKVVINGKELASDTYIIFGRTYLPLRSIGEAFNKDIGWDANTSTVTINDKQSSNTTSIIPNKDIEDISKQNQSNDPKTQFITYIEDFLFREHYDGSAWQVKNGNDKGKWYKFKYIADKEYSYDIKKTDSIVSPYTAIVSFTLRGTETKMYDTKAEAEKDNNYMDKQDMFSISKYKYHYAYQDGKWVYQGLQYFSNYDQTWDEVSNKHPELTCFGYLAKF